MSREEADSSADEMAAEHARLLQFMYMVPLGVIHAAQDGKVLAINPMASQVLMPVAASTGFLDLFNILDKVYPEGREKIRAFGERTGEICQRLVVEVPVERGNHEARSIELSLSRLGESGYMAVFSDVTDKVASERNLRSQAQRFRMLLDVIRDYVIYTLDNDGFVDSWNKSGENSVGIPREAAIGSTFQHMLDVFGYHEKYAAALLKQASTEGSCSIVCRLDAPGGEQLWFQKSIARLTDENGRLSGYSVIGHNITRHKVLEKQLKALSETDPLTGALNRRSFEGRLQQAFSLAVPADQVIGVAMLDIDYFKRLNDTYGHAAGDAALKAFVMAINDLLRKDDIFGRIGGEEFGLVLTGEEQDDLHSVLERVRREIEALVVRVDDKDLRFTVSIGVCYKRRGQLGDPRNVMRIADEALYEAKGAGRNQIVAKAMD